MCRIIHHHDDEDDNDEQYGNSINKLKAIIGRKIMSVILKFNLIFLA